MQIYFIFSFLFHARFVVSCWSERDHHGTMSRESPEKVPRKSREEAKQKPRILKIVYFD